MESRKTYGQFCALARALDHVGDRWTLLIIRELLIEPRSFRQLQDALPGISPNLLVQRIRALVDDGLARRNEAPARSKAVTYSLTEAGAELEPTVRELIRWGARWMAAGPGDDRVDPAWGVLAVKALLDDTPVATRRRLAIHIQTGDHHLTVATARGRRAVEPGAPARADATITVDLPALLAVVSGFVPVEAISNGASGDPAAIAEALGRGGTAAQPLRSRKAQGSSSRSSRAR